LTKQSLEALSRGVSTSTGRLQITELSNAIWEANCLCLSVAFVNKVNKSEPCCTSNLECCAVSLSGKEA